MAANTGSGKRKIVMEVDIDEVADSLLRFVRKRYRTYGERQHYTNLVNVLRGLAHKSPAKEG